LPAVRGRALFLYSLCCLIWGSTWLVIKIGLADLPPFLFAGLRMGIAFAVLTPLAIPALRARGGSGRWGSIVLVGLLQIGLCYALVFQAERTIDSGLTAVLFATFPIWVGLFAHVFLPAEPLTRSRLLAALLGVGGVAVLEAPAIRAATLGRAAAIAAMLPVGAAVVSAFSNVWMKRRLAGVPVVVNLWGQTFVGAAFLLALSAGLERGLGSRWTAKAAGSVLYLSVVGTVVAFLALYWLIPRVPMSSIGAIPVLETMIAVFLGAAILRESVGLRTLTGAAMILAGAALAGRSRLPAAAASSPP
jgi:drug/metabolite transporter (DMT)-like permease